MKDPLKVLTVILPIFIIGLVATFFLANNSRKTTEARVPKATSRLAADAANATEPRPETPETVLQESKSSELNPKATEPRFEEGDIAIPVIEMPLISGP